MIKNKSNILKSEKCKKYSQMHVRLGVIRLMWSDDFHVFIFFEIASNNKLKMETKSHGKNSA